MVKQRIIDGASELFAKMGTKRLTMGDLAKHLGVSKRTIYENFKDKQELLIACIDNFSVENEEFPQKILNQSDNMVEAMLAVLRIEDSQASQRKYSLIEDVRKSFPQVYKEHVVRVIGDRNHSFEQIIKRGMAEGVFRENLIPEIIVHFFNSRKENISLDEHYLVKYSLAEILENVAITFLRGMCTMKGLQIIENNYKSV